MKKRINKKKLYTDSLKIDIIFIVKQINSLTSSLIKYSIKLYINLN